MVWNRKTAAVKKPKPVMIVKEDAERVNIAIHGNENLMAVHAVKQQ